MGSKSQIAKYIIDFLPFGKRFVDLFGGGGSMSHCAALSGKYESVLYNELNSVVADTFRHAINGEYAEGVFTPRWISREEFHAKKDVDGYVRLCWSFGNNGQDYLFSRELEVQKRHLFEAVVSGKINDAVRTLAPAFAGFAGGTIPERRRELRAAIKARRYNELQQLQQLQRLERLEQLEQLQQLERLEVSSLDYRDYEPRDGDVVYCDPPYEGTKGYGEAFDHSAFYDWAASCEFPVWFSSYEISDDRFAVVYQKQKRSLLNSAKSYLQKTEMLYANTAAQKIFFKQ